MAHATHDSEFNGAINNQQVSNVTRAQMIVHQGKMFVVTRIFNNVDPATSATMMIRTGNRKVFVIASNFGADGPADLSFHAGASVSSLGSTLTAVNRDFGISTLPAATFFADPTVVTTGSNPINARIFGVIGGTGNNTTLGGGEATSSLPFILNTSTDYLIRVSSSVTIPTYDFSLNFYERG